MPPPYKVDSTPSEALDRHAEYYFAFTTFLASHGDIYDSDEAD